jgi:hypothetical protein
MLDARMRACQDDFMAILPVQVAVRDQNDHLRRTR